MNIVSVALMSKKLLLRRIFKIFFFYKFAVLKTDLWYIKYNLSNIYIIIQKYIPIQSIPNFSIYNNI